MRWLAAAVLALVLVAPAAASEQHPTLGELEGELMCPTCKSSLDQSTSPIADRIRRFVTARIAAGDTKSEIKAKLVEQFGPAVLAEPSKEGFNLLAWVLPFAGLGGGALVMGALVWRWSRGRDPAPAVAGAPVAGLDPDLERRVDEELARFE
jgi:cytochrome c-type biogenesis protein CcmH